MEIATELQDMEMTCEEVAAELARPYRLNEKEQRLLAYLLDDSKSKRIGDICKALKTTARTLISRTKPELEKKIDAVVSEAWKRDLEAAIKSTFSIQARSESMDVSVFTKG